MNKPSAIILTLAMCIPPLGYAQGFDKLFTTAEERIYLDYLRETFLASSAEAGFNIDRDEVPEIPENEDQSEEIVEFYFGGIMARVDGGRAVWLNGESILENDLPSNITIINTDGSAALRLTTSETGFVLKPGQTVNTATGQYWEAFERPRNLPERAEAADEVSTLQTPADLPAVLSAASSDLLEEAEPPLLPSEIEEIIPNAEN